MWCRLSKSTYFSKMAKRGLMPFLLDCKIWRSVKACLSCDVPVFYEMWKSLPLPHEMWKNFVSFWGSSNEDVQAFFFIIIIYSGFGICKKYTSSSRTLFKKKKAKIWSCISSFCISCVVWCNQHDSCHFSLNAVHDYKQWSMTHWGMGVLHYFKIFGSEAFFYNVFTIWMD